MIKSPNGDKNERSEKMNLGKLKGEIIANYGSQKAFAQHIGWPQNKVCRLVAGKYKPDTDDVDIIVKALNLDKEGFLAVFLPAISPNGDETKECN